MKSVMKMVSKVVLVVVASGCALLSTEAFAAGKRAPAMVNGVVNINAASEKDLDALPGVGAKQAKGIVAYRAAHPFTRTEEIVKVKGFGKKKYEKLKSHLTISGPSNLTVSRGPAPMPAWTQPQARSAPPAR